MAANSDPKFLEAVERAKKVRHSLLFTSNPCIDIDHHLLLNRSPKRSKGKLLVRNDLMKKVCVNIDSIFTQSLLQH